jgi:nicotinamide riboside transporter PnuC
VPYYNLTFMSNQSGPVAVFEGVKQNSGNWFMGLILVMIYFALYIAYRKAGNQDAFLTASFTLCIIAGAAFGAGLFAGEYLVVPVAMLVVTLVMKIWGEG